jgi:hypothetical protein
LISVFALEQLTEHADCVFPLDNTALARLAPQESEEQKREEKSRGFDSMNDVAAQMLSGLTWWVANCLMFWFSNYTNVSFLLAETALRDFPAR